MKAQNRLKKKKPQIWITENTGHPYTKMSHGKKWEHIQNYTQIHKHHIHTYDKYHLLSEDRVHGARRYFKLHEEGSTACPRSGTQLLCGTETLINIGCVDLRRNTINYSKKETQNYTKRS